MKNTTIQCPFTGMQDLPEPEEQTWASQVPEHPIWYFHASEVETEGILMCLAYLLGDETDWVKVQNCHKILEQRGDIRRSGEWWFVKIPQTPKLIPASPADIIMAQQGNADQFIAEVAQRFEEYLEKLRTALI